MMCFGAEYLIMKGVRLKEGAATAEYIERDVALLALSYYPIENPYPGDIIPAVLETARKAIARINAADVAPVRHGRWVRFRDYNGNSILVCSECGRVCHEEDAPYCYCGAKMDGAAHAPD